MNSVQSSAAIGTSSAQLVSGRQGRQCLIVSSPAASRVTLSIGNIVAVSGVGIVLYPQQRPIYLTRAMLGNQLDLPINAISDAATETIGVIDAGL